jgi:ArsR family transcriptional regulator
MIEHTDAKRIAGMLAAVGEPTRMRILHKLAEGPSHVGGLAAEVGVPMVNMSHHLGVMRQAGLIDDAKDGRRVVYSLRPDVFVPGGAPDELGTLQLGLYRLVLLRGDATGNGSHNGEKSAAKPRAAAAGKAAVTKKKAGG